MEKLTEDEIIRLKCLILREIDDCNEYEEEETDLNQARRWGRRAEKFENIYNKLFKEN